MNIIEEQFVTIHGKKFFVDKDGNLNLSRERISNIAEIIGLESIKGLKRLALGNFADYDKDAEEEKEWYNDFKEFKILDSFKTLGSGLKALSSIINILIISSKSLLITYFLEYKI